MVPIRTLVCTDHYLPGWKAGGPIRAIQHLVEHLGDSFQFDIIASDRDLGDTRGYPGIQTGVWHPHGKGRIRYLSPGERRMVGWLRLLRDSDGYDLVYLNSLFSRNTMRILALRRAGLVPRVPCLLAPRGELQPGALSLKPARKAVWLALSRMCGLYDGIHWQAATTQEQDDIVRALGSTNGMSPIHVAPDLPLGPAGAPAPREGATKKAPGRARVVFVSRICRKKNLDYALRVLLKVKGEVEFDIFGPIEDRKYWRECLALMKQLPPGVLARYRGPLDPLQVRDTFASYDLFFFPTRGESYGHVVAESLLAGCPVLISNRTPWRSLASASAGWDLPLENATLFLERLNAIVAMTSEELAALSGGVAQHARRLFALPLAQGGPVEANRRLFVDSVQSWGAGQATHAACSM